MKAYWVRWTGDKKSAAMLVVAENLTQLFWAVDAVGCPRSAFFMRATGGDFLQKNESHMTPWIDDPKWKKLKFPPLDRLCGASQVAA